jgi:hypothetical protein
MTEGSLFCFEIHRDALDHILGLFGKLSRMRDALAWFHGVWTCVVEVFEY